MQIVINLKNYHATNSVQKANYKDEIHNINTMRLITAISFGQRIVMCLHINSVVNYTNLS